jgi:hypothetical protein
VILMVGKNLGRKGPSKDISILRDLTLTLPMDYRRRRSLRVRHQLIQGSQPTSK